MLNEVVRFLTMHHDVPYQTVCGAPRLTRKLLKELVRLSMGVYKTPKIAMNKTTESFGQYLIKHHGEPKMSLNYRLNSNTNLYEVFTKV